MPRRIEKPGASAGDCYRRFEGFPASSPISDYRKGTYIESNKMINRIFNVTFRNKCNVGPMPRSQMSFVPGRLDLPIFNHRREEITRLAVEARPRR